MATVLSDRIRIDDRITIYSGPFVQGAVAVIFSAYTGIFFSRYHYRLTLPQYGVLFIPEIVAAVLATLFAGAVGRRCRTEWAYAVGLSSSLVGMALLLATEWAARLAFSFPLLLAATAFVGAGLGLSFPVVRCYAISLKPLRSRRQILLVNMMLAAGMVAAPVYAFATLGTSAWWSLPLLLAVLLIAQLLLSRSLRSPPDGAPPRRADRPVPVRYRVYPWLALLYGLCAVACITAPHYLTGTVPSARHLSLVILAEAAFWAALVQGFRVAFALIDGMRSRQHVANMGIFLIATVVLVLSMSLTRYDMMHVGLYLFTAIGCAALLPVDTRPGNEQLATFPLAVTAGLLALFPAGLGLSRFGYDIVARTGMSSLELFLSVALVGAVACLLLLPVIVNWRTMAYFDRPAVQGAGPPGTGDPGGGSGMPSALSAPPPRRPHDDPPDSGGGREPGGATALYPRSQASPRRHSR